MTIYSIYFQMTGAVIAVTNLRLVSEETGMGLEKLKYHFIRLKKNFYKYKGVIIIKSDELKKGDQRFSRRDW